MSHEIVYNSFNTFVLILEQFFAENVDTKMYLKYKTKLLYSIVLFYIIHK